MQKKGENLLNMCKAHCCGSRTLSKDRAFTGEEERKQTNKKKRA